MIASLTWMLQVWMPSWTPLYWLLRLLSQRAEEEYSAEEAEADSLTHLVTEQH
jgi:hypothetical protein